MQKKLTTLFSMMYLAVLSAGETIPATPQSQALELKLTSHRAYYAVDRGGRTTDEYAAALKKGLSPYGPAVVLMVELRNVSAKDVVAYGAPRPQFILKGPRAESVCEVAATHFEVCPSRRYVLGAGKSMFLNVISFCNPDKDEPSVKDTVKRLSYTDGTALQCVNWTEPGEYTLSAVLNIGLVPAPVGAAEFEKQKFAFPKVPSDIGMVKVESNPVKLTIHEGTDAAYWSEALGDPDAEVRFVAAHTLTATLPLTEPARLKMAACVHDADARVRKSAVRALQRPSGTAPLPGVALEHDPAVVALQEALKDSNAGVRSFAVSALATWGPAIKTSVSAVLPLLQDSDSNVRLACAEALGNMCHSGAQMPETNLAGALIAVLKDSSEPVVIAAINDLGCLKSVEAIPALLPLCRHANAEISRTAIEAIGSAGPSASNAETTLFSALDSDETRSVAATALAKIKTDPKKLLPALIAALNSEKDNFGRIAIVRALEACGPSAIPALRELLKVEKNSTVREYATATVAKIESNGKEAVPQLKN